METSNFNGNNAWKVEESRKHQKLANYEEAVASTGYGPFNILILLAALPVGWTCVLDTSMIPFLLKSVECDFELTLFRRGIAVGIVYVGMIIAGPLWDFIFQDWITDYLGKRNAMIVGLILDSICNILWAHATSFNTFILFKFLNGILIAGPLSELMPYLSEFLAPAHQPTFTKWANLFFAISNIFPPALAYILVLHTSWINFTIFNQFYETWRVYMLICTVPPILGALTLCLTPKSPKFLLMRGQSHKALQVFKTMYSMNNFKSPSSFKITTLISEHKMKKNIRSVCKCKLQDRILQLKTLFSKPYLKIFSIILSLQFTSMLGFNTIRLWVPQLFIMMNDSRGLTQSYNHSDEMITMCDMLSPRILKINRALCNYTSPDFESTVYATSTIITSLIVIFSFLFTVMTNTKMKRVIAIIVSFLISTIGTFGVNWIVETLYMLILFSSITLASKIASNIIIAYNSQVTPEISRQAAINSINFAGNVGAAMGSIIFSIVLGINCLAAFMGVGCLTLLCYLLSFFLIKKPFDERNLDIEEY